MGYSKNWKESWTKKDAINYLFSQAKIRSKKSGKSEAFIICDALFCLFVYQATFHDYMNLRYYIHNRNERNSFLTTLMVAREKKTWPHHLVDLVDNKMSFNSFFKEYISREWIDGDTVTNNNFISFCKRHNSIVIKPKRESSGVGIEKIDINPTTDYNKIYQDLQGKIVEESISCCEELKKLNPHSMTQIRVVTVTNNDKVHILAATLRTGGNIAVGYNTAKDDIFSQINIETGICFTNGVNESGDELVKHPVSQIVFVGYKIPRWEELKQICVDAALMVKEVRVIGWDVTITDNGITFFEGNPGSGVASMQIADGIGKRDLFYQYLYN